MRSCLQFISLYQVQWRQWRQNRLPVFLVLTFINLMGQVVCCSGIFPLPLISLYTCMRKTVKSFFYYYLFQRIILLPGLRLCITSFSAMWVLYAWAVNQGREERIFVIEMLTHHISCISMNCGTTIMVVLIWLKMNRLLWINCSLIRVLL